MIQRVSVIVIWFIPDKKKYYYKKIKCYRTKYFVGYKNQYNHVVILVIDMLEKYDHKSFKEKIVDKLINQLEKIKN